MDTPALRFGRYESLFRINAGGMAEVFAARALGEGGFEKIVAVKRILPHLLTDDRFVRMFLDEARVAACIESPHVVQTLDVGRDDQGGPYLAMELVVGLTLVELLQLAARAKRSVPLDVALEILTQAATGLDAAHEARTARGELLGIVHRDISPQNVLVGADGRVRVSDFGIAQVAIGKLAETQAGEVKGKFAYLSPEQSHGAPLDRRSDVFALGVVAWETISGRRLFASPSPYDTIEAVRHAPVPRLRELDASVPEAIDEVVCRALARRQEDRWPTARAFGSALRAAGRASGPEGVAALVDEVHSQRVEQMRDRIRRATTLRRQETLPDLQVDDSATVDQLAVVGEAVTRLMAARPADTTLSDAVLAAPTRIAQSAREGQARQRTLAGAGVVIVVATIGLTVFALSRSAPVAPEDGRPDEAASREMEASPTVAALPSPSPTEPASPSPTEPASHSPSPTEPASHAPSHSPSHSPPRPAAPTRPSRGPLDLTAFDEAVGSH